MSLSGTADSSSSNPASSILLKGGHITSDEVKMLGDLSRVYDDALRKVATAATHEGERQIRLAVRQKIAEQLQSESNLLAEVWAHAVAFDYLNEDAKLRVLIDWLNDWAERLPLAHTLNTLPSLRQYQGITKIGEGGCGVVFRAFDSNRNLPVAIKVPWFPQGNSDRDIPLSETAGAVVGFLDEVRKHAALTQVDGCVELLETFQPSPDETGKYPIDSLLIWLREAPIFFTMTMIEGESLANRLHAIRADPSRKFSVHDAIALMTRIAKTLRALHAQNLPGTNDFLIHKDLKPANVLLDQAGDAWITDFGLATPRRSGQRVLGNRSSGTLAYMAPEQWTGEYVNAQSDIWAWGVIFYELLTGQRPFPAETLDELRNQVLEPRSVPDSIRLNSDDALLRYIEPILLRCLEKDRKNRPTSFNMVLEDLKRAQQRRCVIPTRAANEFVGRSEQLKNLAGALNQKRNIAVVGPAGFGKTALVAEALEQVLNKSQGNLLFPDGVITVDLYQLKANADQVWDKIANLLEEPRPDDNRSAYKRAEEACRGQRLLVVIEGAEEAEGTTHEGGGTDKRASLKELLSVLSSENRCLVMTRNKSQTPNSSYDVIELVVPLEEVEAGELFDKLTNHCVAAETRSEILRLLAGHPLAITWAGGLLSLEDEDPRTLSSEWKVDPIRSLRNPDSEQQTHTLQWLFNRSVRGLSSAGRRILGAASLLAHAPIPVAVLMSVISEPESSGTDQPPTKPTDLIKPLIHRSLLRYVRRPDGSIDFEQIEFTHVLGYQFARTEPSTSVDELFRSLGSSLQQQLQCALNEIEPSWNGIGRLLAHSISLLRNDPAELVWEPLGAFLLYDGGDLLAQRGNLTCRQQSLDVIFEWLSRHLSNDGHWQRDLAVSFNKLGDLATSQGNLPKAQQFFGEGLCIAQRLAESDQANAQWQRDLAVSFYKLGSLAMLQWEHPEAQRLFGDCHQTLQRLADSNPANAQRQHDLAASLEKLGDLSMLQRDHPEAQRLFGESLRIRQRLAEPDPENAEWQRALAVSLNMLGNLAMLQRDHPEAQRLFGDCHQTLQRLADSDPANARRQCDLAVSLEKLGDLSMLQRDHPEAQRLFGESLRIRQRLAESDPENAEWQRDLAVSFSKLSHLAEVEENLSQAKQLFGVFHGIVQRLADLDSANPKWQYDLAFAHNWLAMLAAKQGDAVGFEAESRMCLHVLDRMQQRGLHFDLVLAQIYQQLSTMFRE